MSWKLGFPICVVILLIGLFTPPQRVAAHTFEMVPCTCPVCGGKFEDVVDMSGTQLGRRLDLKPLGEIGAPWRVPVCPKCHFVLFKGKDGTFGKQELKEFKAFVMSDEYRGIPQNAPSYFRIAKLRERLKQSPKLIAFTYVQASWQVEDTDAGQTRLYLQHAIEQLDRFFAGEYQRDDAWPVYRVLRGELLRRVGRFEEAKAFFDELSGIEPFTRDCYPRLIEMEQGLIQQKDAEPHSAPGSPPIR